MGIKSSEIKCSNFQLIRKVNVSTYIYIGATGLQTENDVDMCAIGNSFAGTIDE